MQAIGFKERIKNIFGPTVGANYNIQTFQELVPKFLDYFRIEVGFSEETIDKYGESLGWMQKDLPNIAGPSVLTLEDVTILKKQMLARGVGASRINSIVFALRKFLGYCNEVLKITTINLKEIKPMKIPKRQVIFLTPEEIRQFVDSINYKSGKRGMRMRTLVEVLLATGMRISEALALNREDIDFKNKEVKIIGKGNKERYVFLTDRANFWLQEYLTKRTDNNVALFITMGGAKRLTRFDLSKSFKHYAKLSGLKKKITPHILRHTMATTIFRNGGDIRYIQELLGHSSIETTAQYYMGTDKRAVKEAHAKFLKFD